VNSKLRNETHMRVLLTQLGFENLRCNTCRSKSKSVTAGIRQLKPESHGFAIRTASILSISERLALSI
jgi:hypothetical protein